MIATSIHYLPRNPVAFVWLDLSIPLAVSIGVRINACAAVVAACSQLSGLMCSATRTNPCMERCRETDAHSHQPTADCGWLEARPPAPDASHSLQMSSCG